MSKRYFIPAVVAWLVSLPAWAAPDRHGLCFERVNGIGPERVYACPAGVKVIYPGHDMQLLALPPTWNAVWYAPKTHSKFEQTLEEFRRARSGGLTPVRSIPSITTYAGIKARKYTIKPRTKSRLTGILPPITAQKKAPVESIDFYVSSDSLALPPGAIAMLSAYYNTANYGGVPLAEIYKMTDGSIAKVWYTLTVKPSVVPEKELQWPKGYRQLKSWQELAATEYGEKFDDVAKEMGLGDEFGGKH